MALARTTTIDQVEITASKTILIRLKKAVTDGDVVVASGYHRTALAPGEDADALLAGLNANLLQMGEAAVADGDWRDVRIAAAAYHTADVVAAWRQSQQTD